MELEDLEAIAKKIGWLKAKIEQIRKDLETKRDHGKAILEWARKIDPCNHADIGFMIAYLSKALDEIDDALKYLDRSIEYADTAIFVFKELYPKYHKGD